MPPSDIIRKIPGLTPAQASELGRDLDRYEAAINGIGNAFGQKLGAFTLELDVPTGGVFIGIFNTSCPQGWTRVSAFDGLLLRGSAAYGGTGGSTTVSLVTTDLPAHTHTIPSTQEVQSGTGVTVTGSAGSGQASGSAGSGDAVDVTNPYIDVVFCSKD